MPELLNCLDCSSISYRPAILSPSLELIRFELTNRLLFLFNFEEVGLKSSEIPVTLMLPPKISCLLCVPTNMSEKSFLKVGFFLASMLSVMILFAAIIFSLVKILRENRELGLQHFCSTAC